MRHATYSVILIVAATVGRRLSTVFTCIYGHWNDHELVSKGSGALDAVMDEKECEAPIGRRAVYLTLFGPFTAFFPRNCDVGGNRSVPVAGLIMGSHGQSLLLRHRSLKETVGAVRGSIGLIAAFADIAAGGFCSLRLGYIRALIHP